LGGIRLLFPGLISPGILNSLRLQKFKTIA